jgi:hypothetical protein
MCALRRSTAIALIAMGTVLSINFFIQPVPCYSNCLQYGFHDTYDHTVDISSLFSHTQSHPHAVSSHDFFTLCNDPSVRDGIIQSIDLEDEWALTLNQNRSDVKDYSSANISSYHHSGNVSASHLPLYLLKSAFLL